MTRILSAILFAIVLAALATGRVASWCWGHQHQALDTAARAILATHAAGQQARAWIDGHQDEIAETALLAAMAVASAGLGQ